MLWAQSTGAVENIDCISSETQPPTASECPVYDTKQSHCEAQVLKI